MASRAHEAGVSCPHCSPLLKPEKRAAGKMCQRQIQFDPARGKRHLGHKKFTAANYSRQLEADATEKFEAAF